MKNGNILYLFDFDGTLFGYNHYKGYFKQLKETFTTGPYIDPAIYDIRWSILSGRPLMDKIILQVRCWSAGLYPEKIIVHHKLRWQFKDLKSITNWKISIIQSILRGTNHTFDNIRDVKIDKVVYIDNDIDVLSMINESRLKTGLSYIALNMYDFIKYEYNYYL